jgi:hypothetical protein
MFCLFILACPIPSHRRTARAEIYVHFTTAIETDHMKLVLESTQEIIINNALSASGLIV